MARQPAPPFLDPHSHHGEGREGANPPESSDMGREGRGKKETRDGRGHRPTPSGDNEISGSQGGGHYYCD